MCVSVLLGHCPAVGHCRACVPVLPVLLGSLSSGGSLSCVCAICPEWLIVVRVSLSCLGHTVLFGLLTCVCVTVGRAWVTVLSCLDHCPEWGALFCRAWATVKVRVRVRVMRVSPSRGSHAQDNRPAEPTHSRAATAPSNPDSRTLNVASQNRLGASALSMSTDHGHKMWKLRT